MVSASPGNGKVTLSWTAPKSTHFFVFCLASFVLYSFNYTGKFNTFDWTIYWGKIVAQALQPALFLHFALAFPEERLGWLSFKKEASTSI